MAEIYYTAKRQPGFIKKLFSVNFQGMAMVGAICSLLWALGIVFGSLTLVQSHVAVLTNMQAVFLILFSTIMCKPPSRLEIAGLACVIVGCAAMIFDPKAVRTDGTSADLLIYFIVFASSAFAAWYYILCRQILKKLPPFTVLFFNVTYVWFFASLLGRASDSRVQIFSNDPIWGCLGFMNSQTWLFAYVALGIGSGLGFWVAGMLALMIFSPVIVANSLLLEPFVAQMLGYFMGIDNMPGALTWIGTVFASIGLVFFYYGTKKL